MMGRDPQSMSVRQQLRGVAQGEFGVRDLVRGMLDRIAARDDTVRAWAFLEPEKALARAQELDSSGTGTLRGLVFAAKDNFDTHDMPTAYGSTVHAGGRPMRDASCVALLRLSGALLLGKTVSTEFAHVHPGPTRNPWDPEHTPGGSSSGSAAAVASHMVPFAFGSQTTGSVIRPAAYCGVMGFKPTYGEVNVSGMLANSPSFDTVGMFARAVDDLVLVRGALLGDDLDPVQAPLIRGLRIGLCRTPHWDEADEEARTLTEDAALALERAGATLCDFDGGSALDDLKALHGCASGYEFARTLAHERLHAMDTLSADLREGRMNDGLRCDYSAYAGAQAALEKARAVMQREMEAVDVVIGLPAPGPAPAGLRNTGPATFNLPWTALHMPVVTLPLFRAASGLPVGLQICAQRRRDRHLLACATAIEAVLGSAEV